MPSREIRRVQDRKAAKAKQEKMAAQRKKAAERKKAEKKAEKKSVIQRTVQFLKDVRIELKKVIWPSRSEVVNYTIVVLITVVVVTAFILALDLVLQRLFQWIAL